MLPIQCRMARTAVGWGVRELAREANVSADTVSRFERGEDLLPRTVATLQSALESAGVIFLDAGATVNGGPGVRLRG
ncbi:helix-turn-helix domain-containing protein [Camelimonas sp. ID_303_24]